MIHPGTRPCLRQVKVVIRLALMYSLLFVHTYRWNAEQSDLRLTARSFTLLLAASANPAAAVAISLHDGRDQEGHCMLQEC